MGVSEVANPATLWQSCPVPTPARSIPEAIVEKGRGEGAYEGFIPVLDGKYFSNSIMASRPPADAPIATTGK